MKHQLTINQYTSVRHLLILFFILALIFEDTLLASPCFSSLPTRIIIEETTANTSPQAKDSVRVYEIVEQMPSFSGDKDALTKFLAQNVKYPPMARENGIKGTVIVGFIVEEDGAVKDARILQGRDRLLNEEALRVVNLMPKWVPGKHKGENIAVNFTLPIKFELKETTDLSKSKNNSAPNQYPNYFGGNDALIQFIKRNLKYPDQAKEKGMQGTITVGFTVEEDGSLSDV